MEARTDQNDVKTWLAYNDTTGIVEPVRVDPVTDALLVYEVSADANSPATLNNAKIDQNDQSTLLGFNETTGLVEALRSGVNGELLVIPQ